jgi:serine/threonine protein kinase
MMFAELVGLKLANRYEIQSFIGEAGMSLVFNARDYALNRPVTVKVVKSGYTFSSRAFDAFVAEMRAIAKQKHRHIAIVYDQGTETVNGQEIVYLVLEPVAGGTLADRLKGGTLALDEAGRILDQMCQAIDHAHSLGIYHLDLRPSNILFDDENDAQVTDFGFARLLQEASRARASPYIDAPEYKPPEQLQGGKIGPFSDVYALGIMLHQMLTNELPRREWTNEGLVVHLNESLPKSIRPVIENATHPDPDRRYPRAQELAQAFATALRTRARASRRRRLLVIGASLPFLAALGVLILFALRTEKREPDETQSVVPTASPHAIARLTETATSIPTPIPTTVAPTPSPSPTPTTLPPTPSPPPDPTSTATAPPTSTPYVEVLTDQLSVRAGPGDNYEILRDVYQGYLLLLQGRSGDGMWWQVDSLGLVGWIPAQDGDINIDPGDLPVIPTPVPAIAASISLSTPTAAPTPAQKIKQPILQNPGFSGVSDGKIPGWETWAHDNYHSSETFNPETSFDTPLFKQADDPARFIDGDTLQIDGTAFVRFKAHVFQTVAVTPNTRVYFRATAGAYVGGNGRIKVTTGIDPQGGPDCQNALWGEPLLINQQHGKVQLVAPEVVAGSTGRVTVCLYAESPAPSPASHAAFFDSAQLVAISE